MLKEESGAKLTCRGCRDGGPWRLRGLYFLTAVSDSHLVVSEKPKTLLLSPVFSLNRVFQVSFCLP